MTQKLYLLTINGQLQETFTSLLLVWDYLIGNYLIGKELVADLDYRQMERELDRC